MLIAVEGLHLFAFSLQVFQMRSFGRANRYQVRQRGETSLAALHSANPNVRLMIEEGYRQFFVIVCDDQTLGHGNSSLRIFCVADLVCS